MVAAAPRQVTPRECGDEWSGVRDCLQWLSEHGSSALIGSQFFRNDNGIRKAPWRVVNMTRWPWLWRGTNVQVGTGSGSPASRSTT